LLNGLFHNLLLRPLLSGLLLAGLLSSPAWSQTGTGNAANADWLGTWTAQGTLFAVEVVVNEGGEFLVKEAQSLGFVWSSSPGVVSGDQAAVVVNYAGATATILARLTGQGVAVVEASNCMPEFMVVCVLSKGQQAIFVRSDDQ
jgi:hypothetical protein